MLHVYIQKFDVTRNLEIFCESKTAKIRTPDPRKTQPHGSQLSDPRLAPRQRSAASTQLSFPAVRLVPIERRRLPPHPTAGLLNKIPSPSSEGTHLFPPTKSPIPNLTSQFERPCRGAARAARGWARAARSVTGRSSATTSRASRSRRSGGWRGGAA